jgi:hypothetical protein
MNAVFPVASADGDVDPNTLAYPASTGRRENAEQEEEEEEESDDEERTIAYHPYGLFFLRRIEVHGNPKVPRMRSGGPQLSLYAFKFFFQATLAEVELRIKQTGIVPRDAIAKRYSNKTRLTTSIALLDEDVPREIFDLEQKGFRLPSPVVDSGSDMEKDSSDEESLGLNACITSIYHQFFIDIFIKAPGAKGSYHSFCRLSEDERARAKPDLCKERNLGRLFTACFYKIGDKKDFDDVFDRLFPPKGCIITQKVQNYKNCTYFIKWLDFVGQSDEKTAKEVRKEIRKMMRGLFWLPYARADRIWLTKQGQKGLTRLPTGDQGTAPHLLVRGKPQWDSSSS